MTVARFYRCGRTTSGRLGRALTLGDEIPVRAQKYDAGDDIPSVGIKARQLELKQGHGVPKPSQNERILGSKN
jgi:hypothetical protein